MPEDIKQTSTSELQIKWQDGHESRYELNNLRRECPCANCKGEVILWKSYAPTKKNNETPDMFILKSIQMVGSYALQIGWKDGHNTGLYTWENLRSLCQCDECTDNEPSN
ncbi:MAG: DUF971 domain-containing protein [Ignavibacteria bacterium]|nr:DUF971 domain-containing protein [Ignavibacteria bacterium]